MKNAGGRGSNQYTIRPSSFAHPRRDDHPVVRAARCPEDVETIAAAFSPVTGPWVRCGFSATEIDGWQRRQVEMIDAVVYRWAGFTPADPKPLPDPTMVVNWHLAGHDPQQMHQWARPNVTLDDRSWRPEIPEEYLSLGWSPSDTYQVYDAEIFPAEAQQFRSTHPTGDAGDLIRWVHRQWPHRTRRQEAEQMLSEGVATAAEYDTWDWVLNEPPGASTRSAAEDIRRRPGKWVRYGSPDVLSELFRIERDGLLIGPRSPVGSRPLGYWYRHPGATQHVMRHPTLQPREAADQFIRDWGNVKDPSYWFAAGVTATQATQWETVSSTVLHDRLWRPAGWDVTKAAAWTTPPATHKWPVTHLIAAEAYGLTPEDLPSPPRSARHR